MHILLFWKFICIVTLVAILQVESSLTFLGKTASLFQFTTHNFEEGKKAGGVAQTSHQVHFLPHHLCSPSFIRALLFHDSVLLALNSPIPLLLRTDQFTPRK